MNTLLQPLFDPVTHTYYHPETGKVIVNVTRALGLLSDIDKVDPAVLEAARLEGVDMHKMVELYSKGDLDEETLPEWLVPRLAAYKRFVAETGFECVASEQLLYLRRPEYAGTTDLIGSLNLPRGRRVARVMACIDLKRSFYGGRLIGFQTAAYMEAWNGNQPDRSPLRVTHRFALKLHANGEYRLEPFADPADFGHFTTCLMFFKLKEQLS